MVCTLLHRFSEMHKVVPFILDPHQSRKQRNCCKICCNTSPENCAKGAFKLKIFRTLRNIKETRNAFHPKTITHLILKTYHANVLLFRTHLGLGHFQEKSSSSHRSCDELVSVIIVRTALGGGGGGCRGVYILGVLHFAALMLPQQCRASSGPQSSATAGPSGGDSCQKPEKQRTPFYSMWTRWEIPGMAVIVPRCYKVT